jgi:hypothetical protein
MIVVSIGYSVKSKLFATMLTGPKINADVLTPPHGLLLTCRGEKYTQFYTIIYSVQYLQVEFSNAKNPLRALVVFSVREQNSLRSSPMLRINCPISNKLLAPSLPKAHHL